MRERLMFGRPETFEQALLRLPRFDDPRLEKDEPDGALSHLLALKRTILTSTPATSLEDRMVPLTCEDINLMRCAFTLGPALLEKRWSRFLNSGGRGNPWTKIYLTTDNDYFHWRILPVFPVVGLCGFSFICVETNPNFSSGTRPLNFDVGLVSLEELNLLKEGLAH